MTKSNVQTEILGPPSWFTSTKRTLNNQIDELLARFDDGDFIPALGISMDAAVAAAMLGFSVPPVEHFVRRRGQRDRLLDAHSTLVKVVGMRFHDYTGIASLDIHSSAYETIKDSDRLRLRSLLSSGRPPKHQRERIRYYLHGWQREIERRHVDDLQFSEPAAREAWQSVEAMVFNEILCKINGRQASLLALLSDPEVQRKCAEDSETAAARFAEQVEYSKKVLPSLSSDMTLDEANRRARELLEEDSDFRNQTCRRWADKIGCSPGLVVELPVWKAIMEERKHGKTGEGTSRPKAVTMTAAVQAKAGVNDDPAIHAERGEVLRRMIQCAQPEERAKIEAMSPEGQEELARACQEQEWDGEPSPLEELPPEPHLNKVKTRKTL